MVATRSSGAEEEAGEVGDELGLPRVDRDRARAVHDQLNAREDLLTVEPDHQLIGACVRTPVEVPDVVARHVSPALLKLERGARALA